MNLLRMTAPLLIGALCISALAQTKTPRRRSRPPSSAATVAPAAPVRIKVADGRYAMKAKDGGTVRVWDEPWTLYKTKTGYELEEQWKASRDDSQNTIVINVSIGMAAGLYPIHVQIGPAQSPNQLVCSMTMSEFHCSAGPTQNSLPVSGAYNFFMPSPWLLSSVARRAPRKPDQPVKVKLVQMVGVEPQGPKLAESEAEVVYIGEDVVEVQGVKIPAGIYEIRGAGSPTMNVWLSNEGVVLMMQDASRPEQRMELVEFTKIAPF